jgi:hypothetical protein
MPSREISMSEMKATLDHRRQSKGAIDLPVYSGLAGPQGRRRRRTDRQGLFHLSTRASFPRRHVNRKSPLSTAPRASSCTGAIRSNSWQRTRTTSRPAISCSMANSRTRSRRSASSAPCTTTRWSMSRSAPSTTASVATRTRWPSCAASWSALSAFYHDSLDISDEHHRQVAAFRLIAKMPTLAAMSYKFSIGQPFMYPDNSLSATPRTSCT